LHVQATDTEMATWRKGQHMCDVAMQEGVRGADLDLPLFQKSQQWYCIGKDKDGKDLVGKCVGWPNKIGKSTYQMLSKDLQEKMKDGVPPDGIKHNLRCKQCDGRTNHRLCMCMANAGGQLPVQMMRPRRSRSWCNIADYEEKNNNSITPGSVGGIIYCGAVNDEDGRIVYNPLCGWVGLGLEKSKSMRLRMGTKVYDSELKECVFDELDNIVDLPELGADKLADNGQEPPEPPHKKAKKDKA